MGILSRGVQAGVLEAPPAMVKAITDWATDVHLSKAMFFLPPEDLGRGQDVRPVKKFLASQTPENWQAMQQALGLQLKWESGKFNDPTTWKGLKFKNLLKAALAEEDERAQSRAQRGKRIEQQWNVVRGLLSGSRVVTPPKTSEGLFDPARHKFRLDLSGWRYLSKIPKGVDLPAMVDVQIETLMSGTAASWDSGAWILSLPLLSKDLYRNIDDLTRYLSQDLAESIYHECQHMAQDILQRAMHSKGQGLPGKTLQTPQWKQYGRPTQALDPFALHSLDDIEFYPVLQSAISKIQRGIKTIPQNDRRDVLEMVMDGTWRGPNPDFQYAKGFLADLRKHSPAKWKKAVGEIFAASAALLGPTARRASLSPYYSWTRLYPQVSETAFASMVQYAEQESAEINADPRQSLSMIVSDMGWAGTPLPANKHHWVWQLASALKVDVKAEWDAGAASR